MRILVDTDVNLDFVLARQPFFVEAKEVFDAIAQNKVEAYIASITAINIYYFGRKEKGRNYTLKRLEKLLRIVKICPVSAQCCKPLSTHQSLITKMPCNTNARWRKTSTQSSRATRKNIKIL